jgi:hypothetical protein
MRLRGTQLTIVEQRARLSARRMSGFDRLSGGVDHDVNLSSVNKRQNVQVQGDSFYLYRLYSIYNMAVRNLSIVPVLL